MSSCCILKMVCCLKKCWLISKFEHSKKNPGYTIRVFCYGGFYDYDITNNQVPLLWSSDSWHLAPLEPGKQNLKLGNIGLN